MGDPVYEARRAAERAEADERLAAAEASKAMMETFIALMTGRGRIEVMPPGVGCGGIPWQIRFVRDSR